MAAKNLAGRYLKITETHIKNIVSMPQKYIIVNCGQPNQGKSESLNKLINVVKQAEHATLVHEQWQYDGGTKSEIKILLM